MATTAVLTLPADLRIARWVHRHATTLLRFSLAAIFFWFGLLKPLGLSPAAGLVERTVFWFDPAWFVPLLGTWETAIGVGLCFRRTLPWALALLFLQMPGTFLPLVLLPDVCFTEFPYGLTLEGQYIIKNLCLISAAIVVAASARLQLAPRTCDAPARHRSTTAPCAGFSMQRKEPACVAPSPARSDAPVHLRSRHLPPRKIRRPRPLP
ncbi:MAG: hypothetical protein ACYTGX_00330 [Planctomycetota bacterium]|jgi:hypothetical protein